MLTLNLMVLIIAFYSSGRGNNSNCEALYRNKMRNIWEQKENIKSYLLQGCRWFVFLFNRNHYTTNQQQKELSRIRDNFFEFKRKGVRENTHDLKITHPKSYVIVFTTILSLFFYIIYYSKNDSNLNIFLNY